MRRILSILVLLAISVGARSQETPAENSLIDAVYLFNQQKYREAKDSLNAIVHRDSTLDAAYYYLAMICYSEGDMQGSIDYFGKAVELDTTNCWYQEGLASVYTADGQRGRATEIYLKLLELYPRKFRNSFTLSLLADQTMATGEDSLALEYYNQALAYDPSYVPAKVGLADIYQAQGKYEEFFDRMEEVFASSEVGEDVKSQYLVGILRGSSPAFHARWKDRIRSLAGTIADTHGTVSALELATQIDLLFEEYRDAIDNCFRMVSAAGTDTAAVVAALAEAGDIHHQLGEEKEAFGLYERVLSIRPDYAPVLNNYAYFLFQKGRRLRKALKMSEETIRQEPDNPTYLDTYGCILFLLGKPEQAKPYFKHALIYGGKDNPEVLRHYAAVLDALGEKDLADFYRMQIKEK